MTTFSIPERARRQLAAQIKLDGTIEENVELALRQLDPLDRILPEPMPGEAGVLADLDALVDAGLGQWAR